jgi:FAD:protein FMN transferase
MSAERPATATPDAPASARTLPIVRPAARRERFGEARWETWSTSVVLRLTDPRGLAPARIAVERELDAIDRACSRFRSDSEIARVNTSAGRAVRVSPLLGEAMALALRAARLTDGDVDPTVGQALVLAGYDRDWPLLEHAAADSPAQEPSAHKRPSAPTVVARAVCGWRSVTFDSSGRTVRIPAGFAIDLGATAKAWAADRAAQAAARAANCGALVAIGGDIATSGGAPAHGWAVHVTDDHRADHHAPGQTVTIHSGGLATSSTAVRRWRHAGRTMHHIIDPTTGAPARDTWRTVSVAAASCADANIATTSALIRAATAPARLARLGVPARLVSATGRVYTIGAWPPDARRARIPSAPQDGARPASRPQTSRPRAHRHPADGRRESAPHATPHPQSQLREREPG